MEKERNTRIRHSPGAGSSKRMMMAWLPVPRLRQQIVYVYDGGLQKKGDAAGLPGGVGDAVGVLPGREMKPTV